MSERNMRAMMYMEPGRLELHEVAVPKPGPDELLVRVRAATTCGTDLKTYKRGYHLLTPPTLFGHEYAGDIVEMGNDVRGFEVGMRVVAHNSAPCHRCHYCTRGQENLCENLLLNYGAYAEYITVPGPIVALNTFVVPDHVPYEVAALTEPLSAVVHGHRLLSIGHGETVAVIGAGGPIGLMHVQLSKLAGAVQVIAVDMNPKRLEMAARLGATHTVDASAEDTAERIRELTAGIGVDVAIESAGSLAAWNTAVDVARKGGRAQFFGGLKGGTAIELDTYRIHYDELTLIGTHHATPLDVRKAYDLIVTGTIDAGALITEERPLEELEEALLRMGSGDAIKVALKPELSVR